MEKTIVLEFSLMLRDKIEKTGKYRVVMTRVRRHASWRCGDRVQFARGAPGFAVHLDSRRRAAAPRRGDAQGATVYTLSERAVGCPRGAPGRGREPGRRDCRSRSVRARRRTWPASSSISPGAKPRRSRCSSRRRSSSSRRHRQAASAPAEVGGLRGAQGARCAFGPGRARLCLEQGRPEIADLGRNGATAPRIPSSRRSTRSSRTRLAGRAPELRDW